MANLFNFLWVTTNGRPKFTIEQKLEAMPDIKAFNASSELQRRWFQSVPVASGMLLVVSLAYLAIDRFLD